MTDVKLRSFCKAHADHLIVAGMLIVFFTFVLREGLREH